MSRPTPEMSLVVNTYEKPRHLALVLESIARQEGVEGRFELIVADDGSRDGTEALVAAFAARVPFPVAFTSAPHDGFRLARVRNRGAALARGRTLLFLDGDSILPRDHVAIHLARRRPGVALIGDVVRLPESACAALAPDTLAGFDPRRAAPAAELARLARRHRRARWYGLVRHPDKPRLAGGNFSVWRDDYLRINGSDERYRGWGQEDDDLGLRLRAAGVRLESILDDTRTYHVWHPVDPSATPRWRDGVNVPYFLRRGRLTRCRLGLEPRGNDRVTWGLPSGAGETTLGRSIASLLDGAPQAGPRDRCEIEVVVWPGPGRFTRRAECRLLVVERGRTDDVPRALARRADQTVEADPGTAANPGDSAALAATLEGAG